MITPNSLDVSNVCSPSISLAFVPDHTQLTVSYVAKLVVEVDLVDVKESKQPETLSEPQLLNGLADAVLHSRTVSILEESSRSPVAVAS